MYRFFKRFLDIVLSGVGMIVLLPVLLIIAIMIKIDSEGPIIFKQKRFTKNRKFFNIYKFRTMSIETPRDVATDLLKNPEDYITRVGKFLRVASLDELPQMLNIFLGHMSIVGPRPALYNQTLLMSERDRQGANDIRPGLTGWAQVNGRDELSDKRKAELDGEYRRNLSFSMDMKCFFLTIVKVLRRSGIREGRREDIEVKGE